MKKILAILLALALCFTLAACTTPPAPVDGDEGGEPAATKEKMLYYCAYLGDFGLYDLGHRAAKAVCDKYDIDLNVVEYGMDSAVAVNSFLDALENETYDYVLGLGWYINTVVEDTAGQYPDTTFVFFDTSATVVYEHDNIYGVAFAQNEGGFLVSVYSALMSKTGKIATIIGGDSPIFNDFGTGWLAGAKYAKNELGLDVTYNFTYAGENNLQTIYETSGVLFDTGNDIIWPVSGINMLGACQAAEERGGTEAGKYVIGVDYDQWAYYDQLVKDGGTAYGYENLATSMLKNIPPCVAAIFDSIKGNGTIQPGNKVYGIAENGTGLQDNANYRALTPQEVIDQIEALSADIASGKIDVPSYFDFSSYDAFATYRDNADAEFVA